MRKFASGKVFLSLNIYNQRAEYFLYSQFDQLGEAYQAFYTEKYTGFIFRLMKT